MTCGYFEFVVDSSVCGDVQWCDAECVASGNGGGGDGVGRVARQQWHDCSTTSQLCGVVDDRVALVVSHLQIHQGRVDGRTASL